MNWGHKIILVFSAFVTLIITMVVISVRTDFFLVEENYYEEELAFQDEIDKKVNGMNWPKKININHSAEFIEINFEDAHTIKDGNVKFFRPSNAEFDFTFPMVENFKLPKKEILAGKWIINLEWEFEGEKFQREEIIYIGS